MTGTVNQFRPQGKRRAGRESLPPVAQGVVTAERLDGKWAGWLRVSMGRGGYVKRFNLSPAEAAQLRDLLAAQLPG
jgi:hypothetical protein